MLYIYFLERKAHYSHSNKFSKHKNFLNIFWSCYSAYLDLENIVATPYPYFILKNCPVILIYYSFSLIQIFFLLSIVLLVSLQNTSTQLSLFKNSSLTKSTLTVALSHKKLAPCLSQKKSHRVFQSKFAQPPVTKNGVLKTLVQPWISVPKILI